DGPSPIEHRCGKWPRLEKAVIDRGYRDVSCQKLPQGNRWYLRLVADRKGARMHEDGQRRRLTVVPFRNPQIEDIPSVRPIFDVGISGGDFIFRQRFLLLRLRLKVA